MKNYRLFKDLGRGGEEEIYGHGVTNDALMHSYPVKGRWVIEDFPPPEHQDFIQQIRYLRALAAAAE